MSNTRIAFALLVALLAFVPTVLADDTTEGPRCIVRPETCPDYSGSRLVTCTNPPVVIPICYT